MSLTYTEDPLTFRHLLVAHMMSYRRRLPSPSLPPLLFRPIYVQPFPNLVLFEIQFWMLRHLTPRMRTNDD